MNVSECMAPSEGSGMTAGKYGTPRPGEGIRERDPAGHRKREPHRADSHNNQHDKGMKNLITQSQVPQLVARLLKKWEEGQTIDLRIQKDSWDGSRSLTVTVRDKAYNEQYTGVFTIVPDKIPFPEIEYANDGRDE